MIPGFFLLHTGHVKKSVGRKSTRQLRLARAGKIKAGIGRVPRILQSPPSGQPHGADVLSALLAERRGTDSDR